MSPTARTLEWLRSRGWLVEVVEKWIPQSRTRRDLFGIADLIAVHPDRPETVLIQATSTSNVTARIAKLIAAPGSKVWLAQPHRELWVVGWKRYAKAEAGKHWRPSWHRILPADLAP